MDQIIFMRLFCDPRSPRYCNWAMITDARGKTVPIVSGNTNEVMNATWKPYGKILRAQSYTKFEIKRIQ